MRWTTIAETTLDFCFSEQICAMVNYAKAHPCEGAYFVADRLNMDPVVYTGKAWIKIFTLVHHPGVTVNEGKRNLMEAISWVKSFPMVGTWMWSPVIQKIEERAKD